MLNARNAVLSVVALTFGLLAFACSGGKPEQQIIGKWTIDLEATMAGDPKMKDLPDDQKAKAMEAAKAFLGNMSFEFTADGKAIAKMGDKAEESTYTVKASEGNVVTLEMKSKKDDKEKVEEVKVTVMDGKLEMAQDKQKFVLKKL